MLIEPIGALTEIDNIEVNVSSSCGTGEPACGVGDPSRILPRLGELASGEGAAGSIMVGNQFNDLESALGEST